MAPFFGRYEHSLDAKGRVILPARFRSAFDRGGYLTQFHEGCLALWTPDAFEQQMVAMQEAANRGGSRDRNLARVWASGTQDVEVDRSGRLAIPPHLRSFASLDGDGATTSGANGRPVLVLGAIDRVELWNPVVWEERVRPSEQRLVADEED